MGSMPYRISLLICVLFLLHLTKVNSSENNLVDIVDIWFSKSIGIWEKEERYGYYKALVLRKKSREHSKDVVQIFITEMDIKKNTESIIQKIMLDSPGIKGYISDIQLKIIQLNRLVVSLDIIMNGMNDLILKEVYIIDLTGKTKKLVSADYRDIYK